MEIRNGMVVMDNAEWNLWQKLLGRRLPQCFPVLLLRDLGECQVREFQENGEPEKAMLCAQHVSALPERLFQ
jgi:hypothetical protein